MRKVKFAFVATAFVVMFFSCGSTLHTNTIVIDTLRVNDFSDPQGIMMSPLHFSWKMLSEARNKMQSAYQIWVAKDAEHLIDGTALIWDSEKTVSSANRQVPYDGADLQTETAYFWKVRVWDEDDRTSQWSEIGTWSTGLDQSDLEGKWISYATRDFDLTDTLFMPGCAVFRKPFSCGRVSKACF